MNLEIISLYSVIIFAVQELKNSQFWEKIALFGQECIDFALDTGWARKTTSL